MHTLTDEEFRLAPARLLDGVRLGSVTIMTAEGAPLLAALPLTEGAPVEAALIDLAAALYDRDHVSLGRAARIAGVPYSEMIDELGRRGIATIRIDPEDLQRELADYGA